MPENQNKQPHAEKQAFPETLEMAMLAIQTELTNPIKDATNPHFKSKYATLPEIRNLVTPVLAKYGLFVTQTLSIENDAVVLFTDVTHAPTGRANRSTMPLMLERQTPQGQGSAITYARRYALCAVLNIAADEDDDGQAAEKKKLQPKTTAEKNQQMHDDIAADAIAMGYDPKAVYGRLNEELDMVDSLEKLDMVKKRVKEKRELAGMPKDLSDDIKNKFSTLATYFMEKQ